MIKPLLFLVAFTLISVFTNINEVVFAEIGIRQPQKNAGIRASNSGDPEQILKGAVEAIVSLFFTVAAVATLIMFLWGVTGFVTSGGDKEKVASARKRVTWSLIGLILMASAFVIIQTIGQVVGFNPLGPLKIPSFSELNNNSMVCTGQDHDDCASSSEDGRGMCAIVNGKKACVNR